MSETTYELRGSAETWRDGPPPARVPTELIPQRTGSARTRLAAWRRRHELRARRADEFYASSRRPERGLPVADSGSVLRFVRGMVAERPWLATSLLVLHTLAAVAGLLVPIMLGRLVDALTTIGTGLSAVTTLAVMVAGIVLGQALLTFLALVVSTVFGQDLLAKSREFVVRTVLRLPLGKVESASSGDLVTRVTRDVSTMSESVRWGLPDAVIAGVTTLLTGVAMLLNSWLLTLPLLITTPILAVRVRAYLRRAGRGYITEGGGYSGINTTLTETVEGARTVEALDLGDARIAQGDEDLAVTGQAERYTMGLRNVLFSVLFVCFDTPLVLVLILGAVGYDNDLVTLGQITAAVLYVQQLVDPLDRLIHNVDRLQVGIASTSRLLGIADVPPDREALLARPDGTDLVGSDLRFAYRDDHDVLHGIDLDLVPGERLAIVGPSGSGKSTLGRLLAGINAPRTGSVTVGSVPVTELPLDVLRTEVALVTQEHHVFVGTIRDNIVLAREDSDDRVVRRALGVVDALDWVDRLPNGLDTLLGGGHVMPTPAQAQQIALARLVVADPHTLVLDEATSLIDPRTARHLEGSMAALLENRTVVAIAHRLHTAHDADRIAVVIDGRIVELGSHERLVAAGGEYARLWQRWTS
jgi:ABC-type multidrug transport system fused ATPase/permease subunit